MAKVTVSDGGYVSNVAWRYPSGALERNSATEDSTAIVITGRSLREYSTPLNEKVRRLGGIVIEDGTDINSVMLRTSSSHDAFASLLQPLDDRISGRLEIANRKGLTQNWSIEDYHRNIFFDDSRFANFDRLKSSIQDASRAFEERIVLFNYSSSHQSYFRSLLPAIIYGSKRSKWIIVSQKSIENLQHFDHVERDYISKDEFVSTLCRIARLDTDSVLELMSRFKHQNIPLDSLTTAEFEYALNVYRPFILERVKSILPNVPNQKSAPIEFAVLGDLVGIADNSVENKLSNSVTNAAISELIENIDQVSRHFGLHNSAPALSSKILRMKEHLKDAAEEGLSEARVIQIGISAQAARQHLEYEDEIERPAEGSAASAISQVEQFINRFGEWRSYVQDGVDENDSGSDETDATTTNILKAMASSGILDERAKISIGRALYEIGSGKTAVERRGSLRIVHNFTSLVFGLLRDAREKIRENIVSGAASGLVAGAWILLGTIEPWLANLAVSHPTLFAWIPTLFRFLRGVSGR